MCLIDIREILNNMNILDFSLETYNLLEMSLKVCYKSVFPLYSILLI